MFLVRKVNVTFPLKGFSMLVNVRSLSFKDKECGGFTRVNTIEIRVQ